MGSITHFSHEHPLILLKQSPPEEANTHICYGCRQLLIQEGKPDSGDVYGCEIFRTIFLHKSCAQLPMEIVHNSHKQHSLFLLSDKPSAYGEYRNCEVCNSFLHGFFYHCYLDDFDLDIKCVRANKESVVDSRKDLTLYHPSHKQHQLKLQPRPSSFRCDACDVEDTDFSYQCTTCHYWIHRRCGMLPSPNSLDVHTHPLMLAFGLPSQYHNFIYFCAICDEPIGRGKKLWVYYCEFCRYFLHIKCMGIKKPEIIVDLQGLSLDNLPRLPMSDKSVELIQRFLLKNKSIANIEQEISIFSHKHPLKYSIDEKIIEDENGDGEQALCDGCIEPIISPPYYHCEECRYFLHLPCAVLPHELHHPSHPHHPLTLTCKTKCYDHFRCDNCNRDSNGFFFYCTAEGCHFYRDVRCSALPKIVEHETHNHPLFRMTTTNYKCSGCGNWDWTTKKKTYSCESCKFYLHQSCLLLPKTRKSKFDGKHLLRLRFPPHSYHPRPFDCYQCEDEINPNYWLYHCEVCDLSFHLYCISQAWNYWSHNNSKFGQKLQIISHPHPLKYVFKASVTSSCHGCGEYRVGADAVECETCNFHVCLGCFRKLDSVDELEK